MRRTRRRDKEQKMMLAHSSDSLLPQACVKVFINVSHVRVCSPEREKRLADNEISPLLPAASWQQQ